MAYTTVETVEVLEIAARMSIGQRILFLVLALIPLVAVHELLIQPLTTSVSATISRWN